MGEKDEAVVPLRLTCEVSQDDFPLALPHLPQNKESQYQTRI
jgi:hypothetical protein